MGLPSAPSIAPSQSPVPVGLTPDWNPSGGASCVIVAESGAPDCLFNPSGAENAGRVSVASESRIVNFIG